MNKITVSSECFPFPAESSANAAFVQIPIPRPVCIMHAIVSTCTQFEYKNIRSPFILIWRNSLSRPSG